MAENSADERHSEAQPADIITDEDEKARREARNALQQFDTVTKLIEEWCLGERTCGSPRDMEDDQGVEERVQMVGGDEDRPLGDRSSDHFDPLEDRCGPPQNPGHCAPHPPLGALGSRPGFRSRADLRGVGV